MIQQPLGANLVRRLPFLLLLLLSSVTAHWEPSATAGSLVPNAYIIQIDSSSTSTLVKRGLALGDLVDAVLGQVSDAGVDFTLRQQYAGGSDMFQGASIRVSDGVLPSDLLAIDGVQRVWPVRKHSRPVYPLTPDGAGGYGGGSPITAAQLLGGAFPASKPLTKRATSSYATDTFGPHVQTGVNATHAAGNLGAGQLVCMIDSGLYPRSFSVSDLKADRVTNSSGIDYTNPLLGGCFGPGCHVSVGYDLVGDNYTGENTPQPDSDPYASCDPHGTHVSGIVGALTNQYGFSGVAPEANLGMFRVLQAYIMAMKAGCTVINMSINGPSGWLANTPTELMVDVAAAQGIFTVACVGNEGAEGLFYAEQPSSSVTGTAAASVGVRDLPAYNASLSGFGNFPYLSAGPFNVSSYSNFRVYFTSTNISTLNDACSPLNPATTPSNLAAYVVFVQRGTCTFATKQANVAAAGGCVLFFQSPDELHLLCFTLSPPDRKYLIIYNSPNSSQEVFLTSAASSNLYALATMRHSDGVNVLNYYNNPDNRLLLRFPAGSSLVAGVVDSIQGGIIASVKQAQSSSSLLTTCILTRSTSTYGPTLDLFGQPSLAAPGVNILSTYPMSSGGIYILSGTSMASPFIAGSAAVLLAARASDKLTVAQLKGLLSTTAQRFERSLSPGSPYTTVPLQGGGVWSPIWIAQLASDSPTISSQA
ncbi:hypothetical protein P7C70_g3978, partial [Phenoliferia sp. Uapishka_3]